MTRTLNVKFLLILMGGFVLFGTGVHFLHAYQVKRNAKALLERADQALKRAEEALADKKPDQPHLKTASRLLSNYLALEPRDVEALVKYGLVLEKLDPRAIRRVFFVFEKVVRLDPDRHDIRRKVAEIAMKMGRYSDAQAHLKILYDPFKNDSLPEQNAEKAQLERMLGQCCEANGIFKSPSEGEKGAEDYFLLAKEDAPNQIDAYVSLANLYRRVLNKPTEEADKVMDELKDKNEKSFQAYLARARYWKEYKVPEKAAIDIRTALNLGAKEPTADYANVILFFAELAREGGKKEDLAEARKALKLGMDLYPSSALMYQLLAEIELADNSKAGREEAKACLRRGLKVLPDERQLLGNLASLLVEEGKDDQDPELSDAIARMEKADVLTAQVDYFKARIRINQERWPEAIQVLERIRPDLGESPDLLKQIDLGLGRCYSQMQDFDQASGAYRRALAVDPYWVPGCLGMGATLAAMGKIDEALEIYRRVISKYSPARLEAARLLIVRNLSLAPNEPRWGEFEKYLEEAEAAKAFPVQVVLLRADFLAAQGKEGPKQAQEFIQNALNQEPTSVELWIALADLVDRQENLVDRQKKSESNEALAILDKAEWPVNARLLLEAIIPGNVLGLLVEGERQVSDRVDLLLARAQFWSKRKGLQAKQALLKLEEEELPKLEKGRFSQSRWKALRGLANAHARLRDRWEAQRLGSQLANERPKDLNVRLLLFDLAMEHGLEPEIARLLEEIRGIEGPEGTLWRFGKVQYLIWQAHMEGAHKELQAANDLLVKATDLLKTIADRRPTWSRVPLGQALIEDVRQKFTDKSKRNFARANQFYLQAFKGGERNPEVIRRAYECLIERQQWKEADEVLNKLPEQALLTSDLQRLAEVSLKRRNEDRALDLAKKAVKAQPENPLGHLWLGELLLALEKPKKAEAEHEFHQAEAKADKRPDVWVALVFHWVHADQKPEAETALEKARAKIPAEHLALGLCCEAVGRLAEAGEHFRAALKAKPEDVATLRSVAAFQLRTGKSDDAKVSLKKLIDLKAQSPGDADWARNILAIVLASKGDYQQSQRALKLTTETPEGLRAQALILMAQKVHRKQNAKDAIANLEKIESPTPDDRFLLAQLYENVDQWPKTRDQMILLLDSSRDSPALLTYFVYFVKSSVAHQEPDAAAWLEKLKKLPEAAGTPGLAEIETRYFAAQKEAGKAVAAARGYLDGQNAKPPDRNTRLRWAAELLDNLSQASPAERSFPFTAEKWYRELVASKPDQILLLVSFVGRQGRVQEALDLCEREQAWQVCHAEEVGNVCMNVLHAGPAAKEHLARVESWLESAIAKQPKASAALTVCLADLMDLQGHYQDAEKLYRQALKKDPRNIVALNNLAWLLALREGQGEEALDLLKRAMETAGPLPALLDTQGVAYMSIGKADQAIQVLEQAMEDEPAAAFSFHLAEARKMQHNSTGAKEAFAKATESFGLKPERLHPLERNAYEQLLEEFRPVGK